MKNFLYKTVMKTVPVFLVMMIALSIFTGFIADMYDNDNSGVSDNENTTESGRRNTNFGANRGSGSFGANRGTTNFGANRSGAGFGANRGNSTGSSTDSNIEAGSANTTVTANTNDTVTTGDITDTTATSSVSTTNNNTNNTGNNSTQNTGNTNNSNQNNGQNTNSGLFINPLTGLNTINDISRNKPVAVSISNQRAALPTNAINGISQADIVYEVLVEGGITRFVALYQDFSNAGVVGSIRSARHYTVQIAEAYNAMLIHAGGSPLGFEEIDSRGIINFDAVTGRRGQIFKRDVHRIPGKTVENYHGLTTSGASFMQWLPSYGLKTTLDENYTRRLNFTGNPIATGARAYEVGIRFSSAKDSVFIYDEASNQYYMAQFGSRLKDANNNAPVTFTNILVLEMPVKDLVGHGAGSGRQDMNTVGSGKGYFISNGRYIPINWSRADKSSQFIYTTENGEEIELGRGKTYIGITPNTQTYIG